MPGRSAQFGGSVSLFDSTKHRNFQTCWQPPQSRAQRIEPSPVINPRASIISPCTPVDKTLIYKVKNRELAGKVMGICKRMPDLCLAISKRDHMPFDIPAANNRDIVHLQ
ncbi:hypothetical protein TH8_20835 [Thalassospira profundimaris]|nr:hypothetical protein TH8_20835 [Thalassospira profundimaris]